MSKPPTTLFGRRLRMARLNAGLPQDRLGVLIGFDEGTASARMSRYETGVHQPQYETAVDIANVLGIPTAYLYCEDDDLAKVILEWSRLSLADRNEIMKRL